MFPPQWPCLLREFLAILQIYRHDKDEIRGNLFATFPDTIWLYFKLISSINSQLPLNRDGCHPVKPFRSNSRNVTLRQASNPPNILSRSEWLHKEILKSVLESDVGFMFIFECLHNHSLSGLSLTRPWFPLTFQSASSIKLSITSRPKIATMDMFSWMVFCNQLNSHGGTESS
jgi:hypothetical protein